MEENGEERKKKEEETREHGSEGRSRERERRGGGGDRSRERTRSQCSSLGRHQSRGKKASPGVLSFSQIKEERERQRLREKERALREEERRRREERDRQREVERRQREEALRLERYSIYIFFYYASATFHPYSWIYYVSISIKNIFVRKYYRFFVCIS
jgi:hypothetical protein